MKHSNRLFCRGQWVAFSIILELFCSAYAQTSPASAQKPSPAFTIGAAAPYRDVPRLALSATNWDFGQKWVGEPIPTAEIVLENQGQVSLTIEDVVTSCGCAAVAPKSGGTWKGKVLASGASETMTIAFNTARQVKDVERTITVLSNDPAQPRVVIAVKGNVLNPFAGKPEDRITFGRMVAEAKETREIELINITDQPMNLRLRTPGPDSPFDLKLTEVQPGKTYKLSASTRPPVKAGASLVEVQLDTGVEQSPRLNIPVSAFVPAPVFISPSKLYMDLIKPVQRVMRLSYQLTKPVRITEIRATHPDLIQVDLLPARPSAAAPTRAQEFGDHTIRVSLPPANKLPPGPAAVEIHTDAQAPEYQKFVLPLEVLPTTSGSHGRGQQPNQQLTGDLAAFPEDRAVVQRTSVDLVDGVVGSVSLGAAAVRFPLDGLPRSPQAN